MELLATLDTLMIEENWLPADDATGAHTLSYFAYCSILLCQQRAGAWAPASSVRLCSSAGIWTRVPGLIVGFGYPSSAYYHLRNATRHGKPDGNARG